MSRNLLIAFAALASASAVSVTKLTFAQDSDYPPYAFKNANGGLEGFGKDIADGMTSMCDDLEIQVVEANWSDCWSSEGGGSLGKKLESGVVDACMTYTHTAGIRNQFAEFSFGILDLNKAAGLLAELVDGKPKVSGQDDLAGKTVVDVGGWAPTADGLHFVKNKCTDKLYSKNYKEVVVGDGNDEALKMLLNASADAMFVYADQAKNYQCKDGVKATWDCSLWEGFGTKFAYVQTGQFGYAINGTTLALAKKDSGIAEKVNPCLEKFMLTKEYHDICVKHGFTSDCYPNEFFTAKEMKAKEYNKPTDEHICDCSNGYCPCVIDSSTPACKTDASSANNYMVSASLALLLTNMMA